MAANDSNSGNARNTSSNNLDLSGVEDPNKLASAVEAYYTSDSAVKSQLSWHWERNHLMLDGKQWLVWDGSRGQTGGMWQTLRVSKANEYIPRPVTNYIFDAYQTLKGYALKNKPRVTVRPNTQTHRDKEAAKLATLVSETNYERLKDEENYEYAVSCLLTYGTVFKKSYWDNSYVSQIKVPKMVQQPQTDPNTGQITGIQEVPAVDPQTGEELFETLPLGDVNTDVVEPYRIALDPLANDIHKVRWIMEYSIQPLEWIKETYSKEAPGYTGRADEVKEEQNLSNSMRRFYQLKNSSGTKGSTFQSIASTTASDSMIENAAVVKEYYERPTQQHPKGRMIVVAAGIPLYVGDSPYEGPELGDWHPYSECRWEIVPGRFWGKSPFDDACDIQKQINSIDAIIVLTRKTMAIPQKLIPLGIGVEPGKWTGRPGAEIYYRNDGSSGKPETIPPVGVDQSVFVEREKRLEDFKQITGAVDILKGDRPPGVTAASALNMLFEVGTGKLFPMLDRYKKFVQSDQKKQLKIISKMYKEPREDFVRMLKMKNRELSEESINNFIGSDLYDNCSVIIEAGSNIPKLQAAEQSMLMEVAQTGALGLDLPANRAEFLQRLGIIGFDSDYGPDAKRASWENDLLDNLHNSPDNKPVVLMADVHQIHIDQHQLRMKEPSFMSLSLDIQQAYMMHVEQHQQMIEQAQQQQMMQAMAMGQPPQPDPAQHPQASHLPKSGKGVPQDVSKALFSDALVPAGKK